MATWVRRRRHAERSGRLRLSHGVFRSSRCPVRDVLRAESSVPSSAVRRFVERVVQHYPENYAPDGSCVIKLASLLTLDVKDFRTEVLWDTMVMNCQNYSGSTGLVGVEGKMVRSLVFQMELAEIRVGLCMPT